ncbi:MAG: hypothetical protein CM1200mP40_01930 [Gammaproteobacteria bacterium]|nr:MAG: hypothetical protein CM1200mP40_01930 [Gammaproteobacteria bacterium]
MVIWYRMSGVWYADHENASAHQHAMDVVPFGKYRAHGGKSFGKRASFTARYLFNYATPAR